MIKQPEIYQFLQRLRNILEVFLTNGSMVLVCIHQLGDIFVRDFDGTACSVSVSSPTRQRNLLLGCQSHFSIGELGWYMSNRDKICQKKWVGKSSFCFTKTQDFNIYSQKKNYVEFLKIFLPLKTSLMEDSNLEK